MKTVFLCRNSTGARYIANRLSSQGAIDAVVVERGSRARRRKLRRTFREAHWWQIPSRFLDLFAVALYGKLAERSLKEGLAVPEGAAAFPVGIPVHEVEDGNDPDCLDILRRLEPEVLLVFGTSILKPHVLEVPGQYALNIHGGIVPAYRNVHSDFWALYRDDREKVGISVIHLDPGIDSGDVALQRTVSVEPGESIFSVKVKLARLAADLASEALELARGGSLPRQPQDRDRSGFFATPTAWQIISYFTRAD